MTSPEHLLPERIRAQLLALGIPASSHVPEALAGLFPGGLNVAATGLGAEELAKVLIYLADKNIIPLGKPFDTLEIKKVQPGWHFCQFYRSFDQLLHLVAPYIADGLKNNEACFWVMPKAITRRAALHALSHHVDHLDEYLASGQLEMMSHPDWYLDPFGRRLKSFEEISSALLVKQDRALARGFRYLRAAGDTGWVSGTEQSKDFIDYEMKVNAVLGATKVAAICTYRADVTADELVSIVAAHQDALYHAPAR
jgi:hypothetical protein